jgi:bifunctional DNA-binding transcriptional regulator/antitoxin component of YhaV-PrlF toxin-antitoxin module
MTIPPEARREYGFRVGDVLLFLRGSRRSGGFGVSTLRQMSISLRGRVLG